MRRHFCYSNYMHQYDDGTIFIDVDVPTNCNVSIPTRFAFTDHTQKFFIAAALMAIATGKKIDLYGEDTNPIHGNTATLTYFKIHKD